MFRTGAWDKGRHNTIMKNKIYQCLIHFRKLLNVKEVIKFEMNNMIKTPLGHSKETNKDRFYVLISM